MAVEHEQEQPEAVPAVPHEVEAVVPILEALLFASPDPLGAPALRKAFGEEAKRHRVAKMGVGGGGGTQTPGPIWA